MLLTRYDPWSDFRNVWRTLVDSYDVPATGFAPALDVIELDDAVEVRFALPGVKPEDVSVEVHNGVLSVRGERKDDHSEETDRYVRRELRVGSFERRLALPKEVDADAVKAQFDNGVLRVSVPRPAKLQPRRVEVTVATPPEVES